MPKTNTISNNSRCSWPLTEALRLRYQQGLTYQQLADKYHVSPVSIFQRFQRFNLTLEDPEEVKSYRDNRADILSDFQLKLLKSIKEEDLQKAPIQSKIWCYGVLYDKERLERNLSTANVAMQGTLDLVQSRSTAPVYRDNKPNPVRIISTKDDK